MDKNTIMDRLIFAHKEFLLHDIELQKCNEELVIANQKLNKKQLDDQELNATLQNANNALVIENNKKDNSSIQLELANATLKKATQIQYENKKDLDNIMHTLSHKTRKAVANILGICNLLVEQEDLTPAEFNEMMNIIKHSAKSLNLFTEEISQTIHEKR